MSEFPRQNGEMYLYSHMCSSYFKMAENSGVARLSESSSKGKYFRWEDTHIRQLIDAMLEYKAEMSYKCLDFDSDKPALYNALRIRMAELNPDEAVHIFGPISKTLQPSFEELNDLKATWRREDDVMLKGKYHIMEKVKDIRQSFSKPQRIGHVQEAESLYESITTSSVSYGEALQILHFFLLV